MKIVGEIHCLCDSRQRALCIADDGKGISSAGSGRSVKPMSAEGLCRLLTLCAAKA